MRVGIATDHAQSLEQADEYPDWVIRLAGAVAGGPVKRGSAARGSGLGGLVPNPLFSSPGSGTRIFGLPREGR
jgi:hypothetical protein